jgi:hypothetical protein
MAKKFLGLSVFYWVLIVLVVLFFFSGMGRVSEGFSSWYSIPKRSGKGCKDHSDNTRRCKGSGSGVSNSCLCTKK